MINSHDAAQWLARAHAGLELASNCLDGLIEYAIIERVDIVAADHIGDALGQAEDALDRLIDIAAELQLPHPEVES